MGIHVFILHLCSIPSRVSYSFPLFLLCLRVRDRERVSAVLCRNLALLCNVEGNQGNGRPPNRCQTTLSNTKQQEGQLRTRDFSQNNTHRDGKKTGERLGQIERVENAWDKNIEQSLAQLIVSTRKHIHICAISQSNWRWEYYKYFTIFVCKRSFSAYCLRLKALIYTTKGQSFDFFLFFLQVSCPHKGYINCNYIQFNLNTI